VTDRKGKEGEEGDGARGRGGERREGKEGEGRCPVFSPHDVGDPICNLLEIFIHVFHMLFKYIDLVGR
jgi:hypothetical protein